MPLWAQIVLVIGMTVWIAIAFVPITASAHTLAASVRVASFVAIIVGLVENAKTLDEFYTRVYLEASAISLITSGVVLFALSEFGTELGVNSVLVLCATFVLGFVIAFARLRRA